MYAKHPKFEQKNSSSHKKSYDLRDVPKIWNNNLFQGFEDDGFEEMETASCHLIRKVMVVVWYVDDLNTFAEKASLMDFQKTELAR